VTKVKIVGESQGKSRGFGFVNFYSQEVLEDVIEISHIIEGREIDCKIANSELKRPP